MKKPSKQTKNAEPAAKWVRRTMAIVRDLSLHIEGQLLSRYLRLRYVRLLRTIRPLALYFETQVFPNVKKDGSKQLDLYVDEAPAGPDPITG